jgi:hypothetical protein
MLEMWMESNSPSLPLSMIYMDPGIFYVTGKMSDME